MRSLPTLLILLLLAAGAAPAQEIVSDNPTTEVTYPYEYVNAEGEFRVTWPSGCGKLRRRSNEPDADADPFEAVKVVHVACDQFGKQGQGCSVAAIFNEHGIDGGMAGPAQVVDRLQEQVERFGVRIVEQTPIQKELDGGVKLEGLDLKGVDERNVGQVWLRGVLANGDIYILSAWNLAGGLWEDEEYQDFFASFLPGVE